MTKDRDSRQARWQRLEELWEAARSGSHAERKLLLDSAAADEDALRSELESLLAGADSAEAFSFDSPIW